MCTRLVLALRLSLVLGLLVAFIPASPAQAGPIKLEAFLSGANVVDANGNSSRGDPDGSGLGLITLNPGPDRPNSGSICFNITVNNVDLTGVAVTINDGRKGKLGTTLVTLPTTFVNGKAEGCATADRDVINRLKKKFKKFNLTVATTAFPGGALRAQFRRN